MFSSEFLYLSSWVKLADDCFFSYCAFLVWVSRLYWPHPMSWGACQSGSPQSAQAHLQQESSGKFPYRALCNGAGAQKPQGTGQVSAASSSHASNPKPEIWGKQSRKNWSASWPPCGRSRGQTPWSQSPLSSTSCLGILLSNTNRSYRAQEPYWWSPQQPVLWSREQHGESALVRVLQRNT